MLPADNNPHRRVVDSKDLISFANELLLGAIGSGVRAISTEVRGSDVHWRCIFESQQAVDLYQAPLESVRSRLQAIFRYHAAVHADYLVVATKEDMRHLNQLLFLRYEV